MVVQAVLGGNSSPSAEDLNKILGSGKFTINLVHLPAKDGPLLHIFSVLHTSKAKHLKLKD